MKIIKDVAGSRLDPDIVAIFMTIPEEELQACTPEIVDFKKVSRIYILSNISILIGDNHICICTDNVRTNRV